MDAHVGDSDRLPGCTRTSLGFPFVWNPSNLVGRRDRKDLSFTFLAILASKVSLRTRRAFMPMNYYDYYANIDASKGTRAGIKAFHDQAGVAEM